MYTIYCVVYEISMFLANLLFGKDDDDFPPNSHAKGVWLPTLAH